MANEKDVGTLRVNLTLNTDDYERGSQKVESQTDKIKESFSKATNAGDYFKQGFSQLTSTISNFLSPAAIVGMAITAIGAAVVETAKVGAEMEKTFEDLQVATGALGDSLDDLNQSLENVMWNSSATADTLGTAMGNLNTYLGLTGEDLETLTELFSKYSDITGNDVASVTEKASKAFNLWGVETEDMADTLNVFFGVSQSTGMTVEKLFSSVTDGASYLKRLGYSIEDAAIELGSFEKYGMSASTVLTGMKMAISNMTEKGIEPTKEAWDRLKQSIVDAKTDQEALAIATEAFGSRYAAQMVDAIKLADDAVGGLSGNIDAMKDSLDESIALQEGGLDEAWTKLSNRLASGAGKLFDIVEPALVAIVNVLIAIVDMATFVVDIITAIGKAISWLVEGGISLIVDAVKWLIDGISAIGEGVSWLIDNALKPLMDLILKPIKAILDAIYFVGKAVYDYILVPIYEWCQGFLALIQPLIDFINSLIEGINTLFSFSGRGGANATDAMKNTSNAIVDATKSMDAYGNSIDKVIGKTKELSAVSSNGADVNTGMNYHIENGYKIYADGTRVKDGGTTYNNNITVQGSGYPSEQVARSYAYTQALNALNARY